MKEQLKKLINWENVKHTLEVNVDETADYIDMSFVMDVIDRYEISLYVLFDDMKNAHAYQDNWSWFSITLTVRNNEGNEEFVEIHRYKHRRMIFYGDWSWLLNWINRHTIYLSYVEKMFLSELYVPIIVEKYLNNDILMKKYINGAGV